MREPQRTVARRRRWSGAAYWVGFAGALGLALCCAGGCARSRLEIRYAPGAPLAAAYSVNVGFRVVDARPADKGGMDRSRVGTLRGGYGIPKPLRDESLDVVPRTVADATADALRRVGVGIGAAPLMLVAYITEYWTDGYMGYHCNIAVQYYLIDARGQTRWSVSVVGGRGGMGWFSVNGHGAGQWTSTSPGGAPKGGNRTTFLKDLFEAALEELAFQAFTQFRTPAFQQALSL